MDELKNYNIVNDGSKDVTKEIQKIIDKCDTLIINKGIYLVSNLYLKSNMNLIFENDATFLATTNEEAYDIIPTRVAGINMNWYPGVLNIINCKNVKILGNGIINGNGKYWWDKYWGDDKKSGMRGIYDKLDLRWACDYDCMRPRNLLIQNSENIIVKDIHSYMSGFWNIHVLYSNNVILDNITIKTSNIESPSTDGIDIDSSNNVIVKNCDISCRDDSIVIKSGRDYDGIKTNIPSYNIKIKNCILREGYGITLGSEVSGGIYDIKINNIKFYNTDCGFRIKSSIPRKGYIKSIYISNLDMTNVKYIFNIYLNWNPNYSICKLPENITDIKNHWKILCNNEFINMKNTEVDNIIIERVNSKIENYEGISRIFNIVGFDESIIKNIIINNSNLSAYEYGIIKNANVDINNTSIDYKYLHDINNDLFDNR